MEKIRIAVVSTDGVHVNDHFGKARRFLIFDQRQCLEPVDDRPVETLSVGDVDHKFDADRLARISDVIKDCSRVYATRIGEVPKRKLKEMGIEVITFEGRIDEIPQ